MIVNGNVFGAFNTLEVSKSAQKIATPFKRGANSLHIVDEGRRIGSYSAD